MCTKIYLHIQYWDVLGLILLFTLWMKSSAQYHEYIKCVQITLEELIIIRYRFQSTRSSYRTGISLLVRVLFHLVYEWCDMVAPLFVWFYLNWCSLNSEMHYEMCVSSIQHIIIFFIFGKKQNVFFRTRAPGRMTSQMCKRDLGWRVFDQRALVIGSPCLRGSSCSDSLPPHCCPLNPQSAVPCWRTMRHIRFRCPWY